jgi:hypothetical protein
MEGQRPSSWLMGTATGILIAFLGALAFELFKVNFPLWPDTPPRSSAGQDTIEPRLPKISVPVSSKPVPKPVEMVMVVNRIVVPDLVGMDVETAFRTVEGLGLQAQRRDGGDRSAVGWVETQWPPSQQLADAGDTVSLGVKLPAVVDPPMPDAPPVQEVPRFSQPTAIIPAPSPSPIPYHRYDRGVLSPRYDDRPGVPNPRYRYRTDAPTVRDPLRTGVPSPRYPYSRGVPNPNARYRRNLPNLQDPIQTGVPSPRYPYSRGVPNPNARYRRNLPNLQDPIQTGVPNPRNPYRPGVQDPGSRYRMGVPNPRSPYPYRTGVPNPGDRYRTGVPSIQDSHRTGVPRSFYRPSVPGPQRQNRPPDRGRSSPYRRGPG